MTELGSAFFAPPFRFTGVDRDRTSCYDTGLVVDIAARGTVSLCGDGLDELHR